MSTIFLKQYDLLFVHVPKTAGTSISSWLLNNENVQPDIRKEERTQHYQYGKFVDKYAIKPSRYFLCCRDPYDWIESFYFHQVQRIEETIIQLQIKEPYKKYIRNEHYKSFEHWLINFDKSSDVYRFLDDVICLGQSIYLDNQKEPEFIIRYENIADDMKCLEKIINKKIILPNFNKSKRKKVHYTKEMKNKVYELFYNDFETFGYKRHH